VWRGVMDCGMDKIRFLVSEHVVEIGLSAISFAKDNLSYLR